MNRDFDDINQSLGEELGEQGKIIFQNFRESHQHFISLQKLPRMLETMKLNIPESMMKDYLRTIGEHPSPKMSYKQFTHYIARASLEKEIEEELHSLFRMIDQEDVGTIDAKDLYAFIRELDGGDKMCEKDVDILMKEIDFKQVGYLGYEEFIYSLLPK